MNGFSMLVYNALCIQMRYEDIYDGLEVYSKPATAENELYAQLKTLNIVNILHSQIRFVNELICIVCLRLCSSYTW